MNRRERLMATLRGKPVDRPAVSFYELNGLDQNPDNPDPLNIYSHPSWRPLLELTQEKTDCIVMRGVAFKEIAPDPIAHLAHDETWQQDGSVFTRRTVVAGNRTLTMQTRRDRDIDTIWTTEHLLKDPDDLRAFLDLPPATAGGVVDAGPFLAAEAAIGDAGIVMIDTPDPLCLAALLFDMGEYTVTALTEQALFHQLLERFATTLLAVTAEVARRLPGRLWRIYGPEFAAAPYLPPAYSAIMSAATTSRWSTSFTEPEVTPASTRTAGSREFSTTSSRWGPMPWIRSSRRRRATSSLLTCASNMDNNWCCLATWK